MTDSPLPAPITRTLYRGDTRVWEDLIEEKTGEVDEAGNPIYVAVDLSGYTFQAQLRSLPEDPDVMATITVTFLNDGTDGKLKSVLPATEAAKLRPGPVYYDLEATRASDGYVHTYLAGKWKVVPDVTRAGA